MRKAGGAPGHEGKTRDLPAAAATGQMHNAPVRPALMPS